MAAQERGDLMDGLMVGIAAMILGVIFGYMFYEATKK